MINMCLQEGIGDINIIREYAGYVDEATLLRNYVFSTRENEMPNLINRTCSSNAWKHFLEDKKIRKALILGFPFKKFTAEDGT